MEGRDALDSAGRIDEALEDGGGDGVLYAFDALGPDFAAPVATLKKVWSFDCDPTGPKENVHRYIGNRQVSPSNIKGMPVFHRGRVYVAVGGGSEVARASVESLRTRAASIEPERGLGI